MSKISDPTKPLDGAERGFLEQQKNHPTHSCTVPLATNIPPLVSMGLFYKMMKVGYLRNKLCLVCIKAPQSSSGGFTVFRDVSDSF